MQNYKVDVHHPFNLTYFVHFAVLPAPCVQGIDLGILIDRSKSILRRNVERLLKVFMPSFLGKFTISKRKTHIGLVMYSRSGEHLAPFNGKKSISGRRAKKFIAGLDPTTFYQTRTDKGLMMAYRELFTRRNGDRGRFQNVLLTFTDGRAFPKRSIRPFTETVPPLKVGSLSVFFHFKLFLILLKGQASCHQLLLVSLFIKGNFVR